MKKFIRFFLGLIGVVAILVFALALYEPTDITITRSILIKAPKQMVFDQFVQFKNWPHWSPWNRLDSSMKTTYYGTDGMPGSGYKWVGDENKVGSGEMKNDGVQGTSMDYELHIFKPMAMDATGTIKVVDTTNGMVKASWSLKKYTPMPFNAMCMFVDFDKILGKDFEDGLNNLKNYIDSSNKSHG